jgi:hypothetical protein
MFIGNIGSNLAPVFTPLDPRPLSFQGLAELSPGEAAYNRSSPKTSPVPAVVKISDEYRTTVAPSAPPVEVLDEIVVSAKRVPWYVWGIAGALGFAAINSLLGGRRS